MQVGHIYIAMNTWELKPTKGCCEVRCMWAVYGEMLDLNVQTKDLSRQINEDAYVKSSRRFWHTFLRLQQSIIAHDCLPLIHHLVLGRAKRVNIHIILSHFRVFGRCSETSQFSELNNTIETRRAVRFTVMPASHSLRYFCPAHEVAGSSEVLNWFKILLCGVN
jgi:hypothetical protein